LSIQPMWMTKSDTCARHWPLQRDEENRFLKC
jgi:hypothetical protein